MPNTEAEKPSICFITLGGEITKLEDRYADPREISPALTKIAAIDVVRLEKPQQDIADLTRGATEVIYSHLNDYDGFVVTAGKYDLQTIAPRLSFAFGPNLDRTVVVTGSNIPAAFLHGGASAGLVRAAMVASVPFKEVVIAFEASIVRGVSFQVGVAGSPDMLAYHSYTPYGHLGEITALGVEINYLEQFEPGEVNFYPDFEFKTPSFVLSPGTEPELVEPIALGGRGIILASNGPNLPTEEYYSFIDLIAKSYRKGIPVLIAGRTLRFGDHRLFRDQGDEILGVIIARGLNYEVASAKFGWVLRRVAEEITTGKTAEEDKIARVKEWMNAPYVGEFGIDRPFNTIQA